ncbi:TPA: hypothetical protein LR342_004543 [Enterobacter hormaechei]|nr:hypothetical protein [Enterobacter hormaechei]HBL9031959.1 hypothetical protein [Enterobacter hormaechei]
MSGILFVNISDIHVKESNKKRVLEKLSAFQDCLIGLKILGGFEKIILLVSGDLAFSGKKAEYDILSNVFEDLATREGANKQVISSQADSLIKISRIWADFFPANTSNQPI